MIIYTYPVRTAFTERDVEMIEPHFSIKPLKFTDSPVKLPFYFILQAFQLLFYLPKTTHYLCFFAGYHSYLPVIFGKLFKKKVFIQCGGTDAMNMPAINYGNYRKNILRQFTEYSFRNCTKILPVAQALVKQDYRYSALIPEAQGLKNLVPGLKTPIQVIHNGFSGEFWKDLGLERKAQTYITVATGISKSNRAMIKGIDLIEEMAARFPDAQFTLVGDENYSTHLTNIKVLGKLSQKEIRNLFNQHRFYLQLSMSEGFPNALAEAMLCGCIPIGSAVGAIPEIIGDTGFILEKKDSAALVRILQDANQADLITLRILAPLRIKTHYDYEDRKNALLQVFQ
ncbi:glycosyltransferase family 4 protein [Litoribacter alkaliphilus]|uniref:Glycosyltransferase family 4 protein n=1 Tax=Litoribacter ruber TaxID=702568 RepID=A0AAP2CJC8_9BACT|nr:glycosyltransferase family 4 protein [Litoribacter alkaliphilus]MBS9524799.1 glycosyltransferase family 4 protein [Litoribacter alkaliphilus]